ncbi:MAG: hypothetical protein AB7Q42_06450 [Acidimicrobiia bacterium]
MRSVRRQRLSTWIAIVVFLAALTLWIIGRPDDDQIEQPIAPVATSSTD